jgi:IS30 family transposase
VINRKPYSVRAKALTYDIEKQFARHSLIDQEMKSTAYFARPLASWGRGSNENPNALLRQYIPKKRALSRVSNKETRMIQNRLKNRSENDCDSEHPHSCFIDLSSALRFELELD